MKDATSDIKKSLGRLITCKALCLIIMLLFVAQGRAQDELTLTWTSAINMALTQNPYLSSQKVSLEGDKANIAIARAGYLPSIGFSGSLSESKYATFSETTGVIPKSSAVVGGVLNQMIYNQGILANHKIQKYLYASQVEAYRNTSYTTISTAGEAYINLLFAMDLLEVQMENKAITEKNLSAAKDQQEVGSTNMQEVLRWQTQLFSNQQSVESQKATVITGRAWLNQVLNLPLETKEILESLDVERDGFIFSSDLVAGLVVEDDKARIVRDYLVELGLGYSPSLASIEQQLLAQNTQMKSDKRWAVPNFSLSAGVDAKFARDTVVTDLPGASDKEFWKVGVSMAWPLVNGGANTNKYKQSKLNLSALELERDNLQTSIEQSIRGSVAVVVSDFINMGLASFQAEVAQKNYDLVYEAYMVGESDLLDLLDAQDQKLEADISSRVAFYTFFVDIITMEQSIGYFPFLETPESTDTIISNLEGKLLIAQ